MENKKTIDHRYKVKPGLSINSKDLYRRYKNNSLTGVNSRQEGYSLDHSLLDYTRMEKGEQLHELKNNLLKITDIKTKQELQLKLSKEQAEKERTEQDRATIEKLQSEIEKFKISPK